MKGVFLCSAVLFLKVTFNQSKHDSKQEGPTMTQISIGLIFIV